MFELSEIKLVYITLVIEQSDDFLESHKEYTFGKV